MARDGDAMILCSFIKQRTWLNVYYYYIDWYISRSSAVLYMVYVMYWYYVTMWLHAIGQIINAETYSEKPLTRMLANTM